MLLYVQIPDVQLDMSLKWPLMRSRKLACWVPSLQASPTMRQPLRPIPILGPTHANLCTYELML